MSGHAALIDALGGGTAVARALSKQVGREVDREAVYKWKEYGRIPWRWRMPLSMLAKEANVPVPDDFFEAA